MSHVLCSKSCQKPPGIESTGCSNPVRLSCGRSAGELCLLDLRSSAPSSSSARSQWDGRVRRLSVESMSFDVRSREAFNASRLDSLMYVGDIVAVRGTTRVVIWSLGVTGERGDSGGGQWEGGLRTGETSRRGIGRLSIPMERLGLDLTAGAVTRETGC